jgi:hypothetical protein
MIGEAKYPKGTRVLYRGAWGTEAGRPGVVTGYGEKHGRAVLDVTLDDGARRWGYLDQFSPLPCPGCNEARRRFPAARDGSAAPGGVRRLREGGLMPPEDDHDKGCAVAAGGCEACGAKLDLGAGGEHETTCNDCDAPLCSGCAFGYSCEGGYGDDGQGVRTTAYCSTCYAERDEKRQRREARNDSGV